MTAHRILRIDALVCAGSGAGMLAARMALYPLFGLPNPSLLDGIAIGLLVYAAALIVAARRPTVTRATLMAFIAADVLWVVGSGIVLVAFWGQLAPFARVLIVAAAVMVEGLAALKYRAAGAPLVPARLSSSVLRRQA